MTLLSMGHSGRKQHAEVAFGNKREYLWVEGGIKQQIEREFMLFMGTQIQNHLVL